VAWHLLDQKLRRNTATVLQPSEKVSSSAFLLKLILIQQIMSSVSHRVPEVERNAQSRTEELPVLSHRRNRLDRNIAFPPQPLLASKIVAGNIPSQFFAPHVNHVFAWVELWIQARMLG
jgi:hypothetical protein